MSKKLSIAGEEVLPGEKKKVLLPTPSLYNGSLSNLTAHVINGVEPGPVLCLLAAIHGDELNGIEIIRRLLKTKKIKKMKGALIALPIVNTYGFLAQQRYLPDRRDLNRVFPGSAQGSLAARLAHVVVKELINHSTHIIDLHTGSAHRSNLPQIRINTDDDIQVNLAQAFGAPVILKARERKGSLRALANKKGVPYLLYEAGEALRLSEEAIKIGVNGIIRVMARLDMLSIADSRTQSQPIQSHSTLWIRAKRSGLLQVKKSLGRAIARGDLLGSIGEPMTEEETEILSPISGIIIGVTNIPLVHEGEAIFHLASFDQLTKKQIRLLDLIDGDQLEDSLNIV